MHGQQELLQTSAHLLSILSLHSPSVDRHLSLSVPILIYFLSIFNNVESVDETGHKDAATTARVLYDAQ